MFANTEVMSDGNSYSGIDTNDWIYILSRDQIILIIQNLSTVSRF